MTNLDRQKFKIFVDKEGVMRRSDNNQEVSYFGTNYTAPFAYSYRALGYLGKDRKRAIDRDVYHMARMGINAFRLHLWDAELADSAGNILNNEHLDLLDYLIARLEDRGIDIILTAQTNFGNGYPEKNIDTGAFTYDFDKCNIHEDPDAQEIQERYLRQLSAHKNPYTGKSYANDNAIIAMEINNEPCHSGSKRQVTDYINRMARALRKAGFKKPILYNVTHNPQVTEAYYDADIDGTTFQWYPTGLVSGKVRQGNFLPAFDEYTIPWKDTMPNYNKLARVVYEFDPADVLYSHLYPAVARAFRQQGFQWITQFAYDPIDLAPFNTEYPTHYLNLVYTPAKALSMMIATQTALELPRGEDYGSYPENTRFGNTRISYEEDLSEYITPEKFLYSNSTISQPSDPSSLRQIAGHGNSVLVTYPGSGAYFLDAIGNSGAWRLEVMPDIHIIDNPFGHTDLKDAKIVTSFGSHPISINLPQLGENFYYRRVNDNKDSGGKSVGNTFEVSPGIYILATDTAQMEIALKEKHVAGNIGLTEYVAPDNDEMPYSLLWPMHGDENLDVGTVPESIHYQFSQRRTGWDEAPVYEFRSDPEQDGVMVIRRYVSDKISRIPASGSPTQVSVRFQTNSGDTEASPLPEGSELAIVSKQGFTYSTPIILDENSEFTALISDLKPRKGIIMPAPYPVTLTREIPSTDRPLDGFRDIQYVQLTIPLKQGQPIILLPERIWIQ
ncbi:MAG: cellulase family glycosylhydrolase [Muribaculum sp.]|nr:cellulase family glycosylhydrolase [Muribaculum sp.]